MNIVYETTPNLAIYNYKYGKQAQKTEIIGKS